MGLERINVVHTEDERLYESIREAFGVHSDDEITMYTEHNQSHGFRFFDISADNQEDVDFIEFRLWFHE